MVRRLVVFFSLLAIAAVGVPAHAGEFLPTAYRMSASWQISPSGVIGVPSWTFSGHLNRLVPNVNPSVEPNQALGPVSGTTSIAGNLYIPILPLDASVQQEIQFASGGGTVAWSDETSSSFVWHMVIEGTRLIWSGNVVSGRWKGGIVRGVGKLNAPPANWAHSASGTYLGVFTFLPSLPLPPVSLPKKPTPGCIAIGVEVGRCTFAYDRNSPDLIIDGAAESWSVTVNGSLCAHGFVGAEAKIEQCAGYAGAIVQVTAIDGVLSVQESPITII